MKYIIKILQILGLVIGFALLMGFPTMWLWNWLIPDILGLPEIDLLQAIGLTILCGILIRPSTTSK